MKKSKKKEKIEKKRASNNMNERQKEKKKKKVEFDETADIEYEGDDDLAAELTRGDTDE